MEELEFINNLKFDSQGLIPVVVQDYNTSTVLMVAYMDREAIKRTFITRKATYWSRSRKKYWVKGETSGCIQKVKEIYIDCDADCLLIKVIQVGRASCHTGFLSCFYRKVSKKGKLSICCERCFDPEKVYKKIKD